jgi:hypothetical protein
LLLYAYRRRLRGIIELAPSWVAEEILSASQRIGDDRAAVLGHEGHEAETRRARSMNTKDMKRSWLCPFARFAPSSFRVSKAIRGGDDARTQTLLKHDIIVRHIKPDGWTVVGERTPEELSLF